MSDRINVVIRGAGVLVVAGVLATGAYVVGGGGEAGNANAFVNVDTTGDTCTRSSTPITFAEAEANGWLCSSFDAAYDVANTSADASTILIKQGSYAGQTITGNRTSTNRITFDEAPGETVTIGGVLAFGSCRDCGTTSPDYITFKNAETTVMTGSYDNAGYNLYGITIRPGSTNITLEDAVAGGVAIDGGCSTSTVSTTSCFATARSGTACSSRGSPGPGQAPAGTTTTS